MQILWSVWSPQITSNFRHLLSCGTIAFVKFVEYQHLMEGWTEMASKQVDPQTHSYLKDNFLN